jgi:hypothetical protein
MTQRINDKDRQREQRRQERLIGLLERRFGRLFRAEINRASVEMLKSFKATGSAPAQPRNHTQSITAIYKALALVSIEVFGERILDQGKALGLIVETKLGFSEFFERIATEYIQSEGIRKRITSVSETTRTQIVNQIIAGQAEGLGVAQISRDISKALPAITRIRANLIARTETHGAANVGADQAARATGLVLQKEWVSANSERTRPAHSAADGQVRDMDMAFNVGGERLMYPGDPNGSSGNIINCRCAVSHIVKD